jgi:hypothetical protein
VLRRRGDAASALVNASAVSTGTSQVTATRARYTSRGLASVAAGKSGISVHPDDAGPRTE